MAYARVLIADCYDAQARMLDTYIAICRNLDSPTYEDDENGVEIYCRGRWPEGLAVRGRKVSLGWADDLPTDREPIYEPDDGTVDKSEALTELYFKVLKQAPGPILDVARQQAETTPKRRPKFRAVFDLARALKSLDWDAAVTHHKQAVQLWAHLQGRDFADVWADGFLDAYEGVRSQEGAWEFDAVRRLAEESPYPSRLDICDQYGLVLSMSYQYSRANADRTFFLPSGMLQRKLGVKPYLLKRYKSYMAKEGLAVIIDDTYHFDAEKPANNRGQILKWTGPDLEDAA